MRLDKYLKVSRIIKRRTVASDACKAGKVLVNSKPAKSGLELKIGDIIEVCIPGKNIKVKVVSFRETIKKEDAALMYEIIS